MSRWNLRAGLEGRAQLVQVYRERPAQGQHLSPTLGRLLITLIALTFLFQVTSQTQGEAVRASVLNEGVGSTDFAAIDSATFADPGNEGRGDSQAPPASIAHNRQLSFWQTYWRYILAGIVALLAQAVVIIGLLLERATKKKVQLELLRSNDRLRLALESGKSVGWEWDLVHGRGFWFGDLESIFGIAAETSLGDDGDFFRYLHPQDRQRITQAVTDAKQNRKPYVAEFRIARSDGTTRWVASRGRFEYAGNGQAKRMLGMALDITERKQAEEALKNSEEKFSKVFRESPLAIALTSAVDDRYIEVNETFERLVGWRSEELLGRTLPELEICMNPDQREEFVKRLRAGESIRNVEVQIRRKDGAVRSVLESSELVEVNGEPCILFIATDITELKRAEEARRVSEDRFRQFFATLPEHCHMTSPDGLILDANPAACKALGYSKQELIGKSWSAIYAPESHSKVTSLLENWKKEEAVHNEEMVAISKDGSKRTVLVNMGSVTDGAGNLLHSATVQVDITERKRIQEKLSESQNRLEGIVASAMDAVIAIDDEYRIVLFNKAAEKIFGCPARDALGTSIERFIPLRFRAGHAAHIRRFIETGVTTRAMRALGALWAVRVNGEEFPIEASISQLDTNSKRIFTVIIRDITERRRAEQVQARLAAIVQSSDDAIVSVNRDGLIVSWNPGARRMYGYSEEEVIGRSILMIVPAELEEDEREILRRLNQGEAIERYETVRVTKGGQRLNVSLTVSPIRDSDGSVVGASKITRDVTQQKRAEESVRESEERFRHVANTAPVMIWMSGSDKLCTYFNEPWLEFTGRSLQQELGNGWSEGVHPDDRPHCLEIYTRSFDRREPFEMEYRLRRNDGEHRWILDRGVPRFDADGSFAGYIGSCVEVTERKLAQEALSGMSRKLIEAQESERAWIARELHDDINQRIALLAVNLDRLKQELPRLAPATSQRLEEIGARLSELGSDIQTLSHRLHSSKLEYLGVAAAASSFCEELSEKQGVEIDFQSEAIPKSLPREIALCLFRVLQEALQNAMKHSGSGHFEVFLHGAPNEIELSVRDSGVGFDPEKPQKRHGLGLTSMKERLKLVHGELSIDSRPGCGTLIRATVPLSIASRAAEA